MAGLNLPPENESSGFLEMLPSPPRTESANRQYKEIIDSFFAGLTLREISIFTVLRRMMVIGQHIPEDFSHQAELLRELVASLNNIRDE